MGKVKVLYWSTLDKYEKCPQNLLWSKGWDGIDLGYGDGQRKPPPKKSSMHHAVMGIVIAKAMEDFYNLQLWNDPANLRENLENIVKKEFKFLTHTKYIDWEKAPPEDEMLSVCLEGIRGFLHTMKHHKLIGQYSRSEVDMKAELEGGVRVGGRADLIIIRNEEVGIYDGKNSKSKGKYTDPDQLRWYGMLYRATTGKMPHKLGFIYYRYPYGMEVDGVIEEGIDYVDYTVHHLDSLEHRAKEAMRKMYALEFDPTPKAKHCQFCDYESVCDARKEQKAQNSEKRKKNFDKKLGIEGKTDSFISFTLPK